MSANPLSNHPIEFDAPSPQLDQHFLKMQRIGFALAIIVGIGCLVATFLASGILNGGFQSVGSLSSLEQVQVLGTLGAGGLIGINLLVGGIIMMVKSHFGQKEVKPLSSELDKLAGEVPEIEELEESEESDELAEPTTIPSEFSTPAKHAPYRSGTLTRQWQTPGIGIGFKKPVSPDRLDRIPNTPYRPREITATPSKDWTTPYKRNLQTPSKSEHSKVNNVKLNKEFAAERMPEVTLYGFESWEVYGEPGGVEELLKEGHVKMMYSQDRKIGGPIKEACILICAPETIDDKKLTASLLRRLVKEKSEDLLSRLLSAIMNSWTQPSVSEITGALTTNLGQLKDALYTLYFAMKLTEEDDASSEIDEDEEGSVQLGREVDKEIQLGGETLDRILAESGQRFCQELINLFEHEEPFDMGTLTTLIQYFCTEMSRSIKQNLTFSSEKLDSGAISVVESEAAVVEALGGSGKLAEMTVSEMYSRVLNKFSENLKASLTTEFVSATRAAFTQVLPPNQWYIVRVDDEFFSGDTHS